MVNIYSFTGLVKERVSLSAKNYYVMTIGDDLTFEAQICTSSLHQAIKILSTVMSDREYTVDKVYSVTNCHGKVSTRILKDRKINENQA